MLFKMTDRAGKFMEYKSVCMPEAQIANPCDYLRNQLARIGMQQVPQYSDFNRFTYLVQPLKVSFRNYQYSDNAFSLTEMPSIARQKDFEKLKAKQEALMHNVAAAKRSNTYTIGSASTSNTISFNYAYTASTAAGYYQPNLAGTIRLY
jgi:hypothetical protein